MQRFGLLRKKSRHIDPVALIGQITKLDGIHYTLCAYPSDDARYPDDERKSVASFLRSLGSSSIRGTPPSGRHDYREGDIVSFWCRLGERGGVAYDLVNLSSTDSKRFPRVRSSGSMTSSSTESFGLTPSETSADFPPSMSAAVAVAVRGGTKLTFEGKVRSLPFQTKLGIMSVEGIKVAARDQHIIDSVSCLVGSTIPFRLEENEYKVRVGQTVIFHYGSFPSTYGPRGRTFRAINMKPANSASGKHTERDSTSRPQSRKASFASQPRDSQLTESPFAYYVGVILRLPGHIRDGSIDIVTAHWLADHLEQHKGVLCQAIDVHAPTQRQLHNRFPKGLPFREEDTESLNPHISPRLAKGDIVLFQMDDNAHPQARRVIDVSAEAYTKQL